MGRKHNIGYLRVFGSTRYIMNKWDNLGKFDPKADEGIFMGYSLISKAFRVYNKRRECIDETIDVTFDEAYEELSTEPKEYESLEFNESHSPREDNLCPNPVENLHNFSSDSDNDHDDSNDKSVSPS